ncbi:MAG: hydroxyacylglutathione hydrolase [Myxococcota bacterium]
MESVVRVPREPFVRGGLEVHQVPAWKDNLVWVLRCVKTNACAVVDGPLAEGALELIDGEGWKLTAVLNTHTHPDHVGINRDLHRRGRLAGLEVCGPAGDATRVPGITKPVDEGDEVRVGEVVGKVWRTDGHLNGHVSFLFDGLLFCGDTLFGAGCGYLFDGPPEAMAASLRRLATLPEDTLVCCAHEYTEDNLRFAWSVNPSNAALKARIQTVFALRARGECSVPSTVGEERATNPFIRTADKELRRSVGEAFERDLTSASDDDVFAATRALKDRKDYKSIADNELPVR